MSAEILVSIILTFIVVGGQFFFFLKSKKECVKLKNLFPENESKVSLSYHIEEDILDTNTKKVYSIDDYLDAETNCIVDIKLLHPVEGKKFSDNFIYILDSTNQYLKNNYDTTADFNILCDIAERISDAEENKVAASISLPLYLGLMGTFIGVILGIIYIVLSSDAKSIITEQSIQSFLSGVFIAMIGSLFGLALTTWNNSVSFKNAKAERDYRINEYLNFLQTNLLPTFENTLAKNIRDFKENLNSFNIEFSNNIGNFSGTIPAITDNLKLQTDFIKEFNRVDVPKLAATIIAIFEQLKDTTKVFSTFNRYATNLQKNLSTSDELLDKLMILLNRFSEFEDNIKHVGELIKVSETNYGQIGIYLVKKLDALDERYRLISQLVEKTEDDIKFIANTNKDKVEKLSSVLDEKIADINDETINVVNVYLSKIKETTHTIEEEFKKTLSTINNGNVISKLNKIEEINSNLIKINNKFENQNRYNQNSDFQILVSSLDRLTRNIENLRNTMRPSIFKPVQFFKFVFSTNGGQKKVDEGN